MPPAAGKSPGECEASQAYYFLKIKEAQVQEALLGGHCQAASLTLRMAAHSVRGGGVAW